MAYTLHIYMWSNVNLDLILETVTFKMPDIGNALIFENNYLMTEAVFHKT